MVKIDRLVFAVTPGEKLKLTFDVKSCKKYNGENFK